MKITKRAVDALGATERRKYVYDSGLPGFGLVLQPSGVRTFFVEYRLPGAASPRRMTIGRYGPVTVELARTEARRLLGRVAHGEDPSAERVARRAAPTVAELGEAFLDDVRARRKATTAAEHARRWQLHIVPSLGSRQVRDVTPAQVAVLHRKLRSTPYEANRVRALLGAFFSFAERQGVCTGNPANRVQDYPEHKRERFLTPAEIARLGAALRTAERTGLPPARSKSRRRVSGPTRKHRPKFADVPRPADSIAVAAIRFLLFSGWREQEALTLRWSDLDIARGVALLPDSKTGRSARRLGSPAVHLLAELPKVHGCPFVFPGRDLKGPRREIVRTWYAVRQAAGLEDVRLHDLRHSFASAAASGGGSLLMIGALLGHTDAETTQRYAHLLSDPVQAVADAAAGQLAEWLDREPSTPACLARA